LAPRPPSAPAPSASASATADAGAPSSLEKRADQCLADPACDAAEADRLFRAAYDAGEDVDCFRFAAGAGTPPDAASARACLGRDVAKAACTPGNSAGLYEAELAVYRIDGVGGPVDIAGARAVFAKCFDDVTKSAVLDHA